MTAEDLYRLYVERLGYPTATVAFLLANGAEPGASSAPDAYREPRQKPSRPWLSIEHGSGYCVRCGSRVVVSALPEGVSAPIKRGPMPLTDAIVAMRIRRQTRIPQDAPIPKWLIDLKRAQLKLKHAIQSL